MADQDANDGFDDINGKPATGASMSICSSQ